MNYKLLLCAWGCATLLASCNNNVEQPAPVKKEALDGHVQKGPFVSGATVTIAELNELLDQTGRSYSTTIADNFGRFEQRRIELVSPYALLKADGYYFDEVTGKASSGSITLQALADLSDRSTVNVNVLTHLERPRAEYLVREGGMDFTDAKWQAQAEVLSVFGIESARSSVSEALDVSGSGMLLAVSCILQGYLTAGEVVELMAGIANDLRTDGTLDDASLGSRLVNNASLLRLEDIRSNMEEKYQGQADIPDFESHVRHFIETTKFETTQLITYPAQGLHGLNLLSKDVTSIKGGDALYALKANLPEGTSLQVVLKGGDWAVCLAPYMPVNWQLGNYDETTHTCTYTVAQAGEDNEMYLSDFRGDAQGGITIEYYENGADTPTRVKRIDVTQDNPTIPADSLWTAI